MPIHFYPSASIGPHGDMPARRLLATFGVRLVDIGARCGVSASTVSAWVRGFKRPTAEGVDAMIDALEGRTRVRYHTDQLFTVAARDTARPKPGDEATKPYAGSTNAVDAHRKTAST